MLYYRMQECLQNIINGERCYKQINVQTQNYYKDSYMENFYKSTAASYYGTGDIVPAHMRIEWHFLEGYLKQTRQKRISRGEIKP